MTLTKRQLAKAARLYALALLANQDTGGAETDDETAVMQQAIDNAGKALRRLGFEPTELATIGQCIERAARLRPVPELSEVQKEYLSVPGMNREQLDAALAKRFRK